MMGHSFAVSVRTSPLLFFLALYKCALTPSLYSVCCLLLLCNSPRLAPYALFDCHKHSHTPAQHTSSHLVRHTVGARKVERTQAEETPGDGALHVPFPREDKQRRET